MNRNTQIGHVPISLLSTIFFRGFCFDIERFQYCFDCSINDIFNLIYIVTQLLKLTAFVSDLHAGSVHDFTIFKDNVDIYKDFLEKKGIG